MKLGIVGGALQGMEGTILAKKAGVKTVVLDRWTDAPALSLADEGIIIDTIKDEKRAIKIFEDCDAVLPANEDLETLEYLSKVFSRLEVPLIFDMKAYQISSSKLRSNEYMKRLKVPTPEPWPKCGFPVVVKPSGESGSVAVTRATNLEEMRAGEERVRKLGQEVVVQEFVEGPSISVEVIGDGKDAIPLVTTEVFLDDGYDCKMVRAPIERPDVEMENVFAEAGRRMAVDMGLRGIMDVEAIVAKGIPKVLEIDARIPSQTPMAVLHSTGINMMEMMMDVFVAGELRKPPVTRDLVAYYEHIAVDGNSLRSCGEGVFSEVRKPRLCPGLFGSDEMITDYQPGKESWRATIICTGGTAHQADEKRHKVLRSIMDKSGIASYIDPVPEE
jgi:3-methylornithine--L-lysine ligase